MDVCQEKSNICIIEYDEKSLGHAFVSKVYTSGGVDISIRFVKQKALRGGLLHDPESCSGRMQRVTLSLTPEP